MDLITEAEKALMRNWRTVALYILLNVLAGMAYDYGTLALEQIVPEDLSPKPLWFVAVTLSMDLALAAAMAATQAAAFAAIGAEMDRPLWKHAGPADAIRRFFMLWFIIALVFFAIIRLQGSLIQQGLDHAAGALLMPRIFWTCVYMPIGVCVMYGGKLVWEELPDRLSPILHQFPKALVAIVLGLVQFLVLLTCIANLPEAYDKSVFATAAINVPLLLIESLTFAVMWLVCMEHRDTASERDDDFDF